MDGAAAQNLQEMCLLAQLAILAIPGAGVTAERVQNHVYNISSEIKIPHTGDTVSLDQCGS